MDLIEYYLYCLVFLFDYYFQTFSPILKKIKNQINKNKDKNKDKDKYNEEKLSSQEITIYSTKKSY